MHVAILFPGEGTPHIKGVGMLVVSLSRAANNGWSTDNVWSKIGFALSFVIVFGFALLCCNIICPNNLTEIDWSYRRLLLLLGSIQGVSALFIVFSSSGERTPPYLQAILGNFSIPITLLFR